MGWVTAGLGIVNAIMGRRSAKKASQQALTGYNYLKGDEGVQQAQEQGQEAGGLSSALLGLGGDTEAAEAGFDRYRESTGYQFRFSQGQDAITTSAAAKGLLNSGATAKGLTKFGQDFGSNEFSKYLTQLQGKQTQGLNAAYNVGQAGSSGGTAAGEFTQGGAKDTARGLGSAVGGFLDMGQQAGWIS